MIFQELSVLPNRSVAENLFVLREPRGLGWRVDAARMVARRRSLIDRYGFALSPTDARRRSRPSRSARWSRS